MIKKYRNTLILTSIITLLPIVAGLILWNKLPTEIATHFGANNAPGGFSSKGFAVFGMPFIILALHWLCTFVTTLDPKAKNITDKSMKLVLWICPAVSLLMGGVTYSYALNNELRIGMIVILFMGLLFIVIGNYLPKVKQNFSLGIKLPWTLDDEENWNKTHRLAGKLWVLCGVLVCLTAVLENPVIFFAVLILGVIVPTVYSYRIYKSKK